MSRKRVWFSSMDDVIRENSDKTDLQLVDLLGNIVTESAVKKRRQSLGIRHARGRRATAKAVNKEENMPGGNSERVT
jgi:hypothetical protein